MAERENVLPLCPGVAGIVLKPACKPVQDLVTVWPSDVVAVLDRQYRPEQARFEHRVERPLVAGPAAEPFGDVGDKRGCVPGLKSGKSLAGIDKGTAFANEEGSFSSHSATTR